MRARKLLLETAQMVCTVLHKRGIIVPYNPSQPFNPFYKWIEADRGINLCWLMEHGKALREECLHRFGTEYKAGKVIRDIEPLVPFRHAQPRTFFNGARHKKRGIDFTHLPVHEAYRTYLNVRWPGDVRHPKWTNRNVPEWSIIGERQ